MKIVKTGDISRIFGDDLQTFGQLPAGNYKIGFAQMEGFYLEDIDSFTLNEKPYGKHPLKIDKAIKLYDNTNRSVGIILSGDKGMGKSMFARLLSDRFATTHNMPTIVVTEAYKGITDFIESIKQECVILFDEFEKIFDNSEHKERQDKLLGLFDGISQTKRLYMVTVNEIRRVNQYMINRPGRFHYHLKFGYPTVEEVELYLRDKLKPEYYNQIKLVQRFSSRFDLNYDSLRAIAFELNLGYPFLETIGDLNVSSAETSAAKYDIEVYHSNGIVVRTDENLNLMSPSADISYYTPDGDYVSIDFSPLEIEIQNKEHFTAEAGQVTFKVSYDSDNTILKDGSGITVSKIVFAKRQWGKPVYGKEMEGLLV